MTDDDAEGAEIDVRDWSDIDSAPPNVSGQEKELVAELFRNGAWDSLVWIPRWKLVEETKIQTVHGSDHLAAGIITDHSDKAWRLSQDHATNDHRTPSCYLPKSVTVLFRRTEGLEDIESPQRGLDDY